VVELPIDLSVPARIDYQSGERCADIEFSWAATKEFDGGRLRSGASWIARWFGLDHWTLVVHRLFASNGNRQIEAEGG